ncbi:DUF1285 domain-containing protein [Mangrovicoccus algicola]|uniref:DUF1285 domain-containing protein n=1 Tax=Mangrovicoccus algicola TaxID=2771008 RepID=A0A8J6Z5V7_9RHOB|nr:DUF1285 domain-containing protein [Mangrovicoccus algicola]MBE3636920.1 DUF1285 domain-containing protein [Mangrovicoccus algicola]
MTKDENAQNIVRPDASALIAAAGAVAGRGPAPVHLWDPPFCGDLDMRIARDGTWFYQGSPIARPAMVRLFASVLKREGDAYFLVTPAEKVGITVEDVPFLAVDFAVAGDGADRVLTFVTNTGEEVAAGPGHAIRMETGADADPAPYLHVRAGLEARIDRKSFYRLVDLGEIEGAWFGIRSGGAFFALAPAEALS